MATLLFIEQDPSIRPTVQQALSSDAHDVLWVQGMERALGAAANNAVDMIIVDFTNGVGDGAALCRQIRATPGLAGLPLLFLADALTASEVAHMLDAGSDDCVRKPFAARELAARVRALMRRNRRPSMYILIDSPTRSVQVRGRKIDLTPTEYELLVALCQNPGEHMDATRLLEQVWHYPPGDGDPALVRNHVRNLRRKLEHDPDRPRIVTSAHGRGYAVSIGIERR